MIGRRTSRGGKKVELTVLGLGGPLCTVELAASADLPALQREVEAKAGIPFHEQRFVLGGEVLQSLDQLHVGSDDSPLEITLVRVVTPLRSGKSSDFYELLGSASQGCFFSSQIPVKEKATVQRRILDQASKEQLNNIILQHRHQHPNIIQIFEVFAYEHDKYHVISECCFGGDLFDFVVQRHSLSENVAKAFMRQLLHAVGFLHCNLVCHRDIKLENCLLASLPTDEHLGRPLLKLAGFDFACELAGGSSDFAILSEVCGTPSYMAPEVLHGCYDLRCDLWSCGIVLYAMLCGQLALWADSEPELLRQVKQGHVAFDARDWHSFSSPAQELTRKFLQVTPGERPAAIAALEHEWLAEVPVAGSSTSCVTPS